MTNNDQAVRKIDDHATKMRDAIYLLSSMVTGGEQHSEHSRHIVKNALVDR